MHDRLHLSEKLPAFGLLIVGGELVIREAQLLDVHCLSPRLRSQLHRGAEGAGFPKTL